MPMTITYQAQLHCTGRTTTGARQCSRTISTGRSYPTEPDAQATTAAVARARGWEVGAGPEYLAARCPQHATHRPELT